MRMGPWNSPKNLTIDQVRVLTTDGRYVQCYVLVVHTCNKPTFYFGESSSTMLLGSFHATFTYLPYHQFSIFGRLTITYLV